MSVRKQQGTKSNNTGIVRVQKYDKGKPGESRGRKAMGLRQSNEDCYDCQVAEIDALDVFRLA